MKRTTIMLPDELDAQLRLEAHVEGVSVAEVARQAIERGLASKPRRRRKLTWAAAGDGPEDLSASADHYLAQALNDDYERQQREYEELKDMSVEEIRRKYEGEKAKRQASARRRAG